VRRAAVRAAGEKRMNTPDEVLRHAAEAEAAGKVRRAEEIYRNLLRIEPKNARVWLALGKLCATQDRLLEAAAYLRQALEYEPKMAAGHFQLGDVLLRQQKYADAAAAYRLGLELQPNQCEALVNLGYALGEQDRLDEALACYERARALAPALPEIHHNLGNVLREKGRLDEALASYDTALGLRPDYAKAHINKGVALVSTGALAEAVAALRRGVELKPDFAEAHNSLGTALSANGELDAAVAEYERAIQLKPDYADAQWNRSLGRLLRGDYERGWPDYEWRWRCKRTTPLPPLTQPRWDGSPLAGRTILLYAEQGLGDTLHFVRYAPFVKTRGGRVIVQCQGALIPLLSRTGGIDELAAWGAPSPASDVWLPLMSVPAVMGTTLATIPAEIPYLFADPALVEHWRRQLAAIGGLRVGIAWQGSPRHAWDRHRSVPLAAFAPLARVPGVRLISLQKGPGAEQLQAAGGSSIIGFGELLDRAGAFTDTAAILKNLDLVVTVDSAIAHLAGGLGVPVWLALHHTPDWRWLLDRADSPWYPTARLFRQPSPGAWAPVFDEIAAALPALAERCTALRLLVAVSAGELLDQLAILRIKAERIADPDMLRNVRLELEAVAAVRETVATSPALADLERELKEVNERLWDIEDAIRLHEERQDFGAAFIELARSVYRTNEHRAALKRAVNELLQSKSRDRKGALSRTAP
jgi:tetratricopeptide (TPR) repeat protein